MPETKTPTSDEPTNAEVRMDIDLCARHEYREHSHVLGRYARALKAEREHAERLATTLEYLTSRTPIGHFLLHRAPGTGVAVIDAQNRASLDADLVRIQTILADALRAHSERRHKEA